MIIISLFGGLGNQMFQYACGKAKAAQLGTELFLDTSLLEDTRERVNFTQRDYALSVFGIKGRMADVKLARQFVPDLRNCSKVVLLYYKLFRWINGRHYYDEKLKFRVSNSFFNVKDNTYLYGYYQTENYFLQIRDEIVSSFRLKEVPDERNNRLIDNLNSQTSVAIHVRRGDYINSPFSMLDIEYYKNAINFISEKVENPTFYVFSNDIKWVRENFAFLGDSMNIIDHNQGKKSYLDLVLMSNCKHNICANSSFSWWGAWLNQNPDKIVIVPEKWFKDKSYVNSTYDLIPKEWIKK